MKIWLKERIGNPELFTGRKTGKTALMQRLFNITFNKNENIVPFYFEIRETDQWLADFAEEFFLTFVYQFIAFKTRKREYMDTAKMGSFKNAAEIEALEHEDLVNEYKVLADKLQKNNKKLMGEYSHFKGKFAEYETVWSYSSSPVYKKDIQIDIFAKAKDSEYSLIGEVKHRRAKFRLKSS